MQPIFRSGTKKAIDELAACLSPKTDLSKQF